MTPQSSRIRRCRVPATRLPFVNAEITETSFAGERRLVSSIWGGSLGGRIYFWNPDTGAQDGRQLPDGIPGAYMLREGPDGKLYLGCGNGDLVRYDGEADEFEVLVRGELRHITWGGAVTGRHVVWAASPGEAAVYDWQEKRLVQVFRPLDPESPPSLYGHALAETPDGNVMIGMNTPQSRLFLLDLETLERRRIEPALSKALSSIRDLAFLSDHEFAFQTGSELVICGYPDMRERARIAAPEGVGAFRGRQCRATGEYFAASITTGKLLRLDRSHGCFEVIAEDWVDGVVGSAAGVWKGTDFCAVTIAGTTRRFQPATASSDSIVLDAEGVLPAHALCAAPDRDLVAGAPFINQRFWLMNAASGEGRDCGRAASGGGQVNQIVWDAPRQRFLLSSYTSCSVTAFDPAREPAWPENPQEVASAHQEGQMRPMALACDGDHAWMATSPQYGQLGGALCRIDLASNAIDVWRHIVPDQKINSLLLDPERRRVYFASEIHADCNSAPPTQSTARVAAFCVDSLEVLRSDAVCEGAPRLVARALMEDGRVLVEAGNLLYAWDPDAGDAAKIGEAPAPLLGAVSWRPDCGLLLAARGALYRGEMRNGALQLELIVHEDAVHMHVAGDSLWYASGEEIVRLPLAELG